jgi:hypothetical protein
MLANILSGRFMMYAAGALLLALVTVGTLYRFEVQASGRIRAESAQFEQALSDQAGVLRAVRAEQERADELLARRERERTLLYREVNTLKRRLTDEQQENDELRRWMSAALPGAVIEWLRQAGARGDPEGLPAGGAE